MFVKNGHCFIYIYIYFFFFLLFLLLGLQEQITSMETRNKRLMEVFKKKSLEMREAIYRLTGYRVDSTTDNHYKLTNMYVESSEDFFLFEVSSPVSNIFIKGKYNFIIM